MQCMVCVCVWASHWITYLIVYVHIYIYHSLNDQIQYLPKTKPEPRSWYIHELEWVVIVLTVCLFEIEDGLFPYNKLERSRILADAGSHDIVSYVFELMNLSRGKILSFEASSIVNICRRRRSRASNTMWQWDHCYYECNPKHKIKFNLAWKVKQIQFFLATIATYTHTISIHRFCLNINLKLSVACFQIPVWFKQ